MNAPQNHPDPLIQSILDDTKALAQSAAALAGRRHRLRSNIVQVAALSIVLLAGTIWFIAHQLSYDQTPNIDVNDDRPAMLQLSNAPGGFVKMYSTKDPQPDVISPAASDEERRLLEDLKGIPVILVKDASGQISRIHIIER